MNKIIKSIFFELLLLTVLVFFSACSAPSVTPGPTATTEPVITPKPAITPEPAVTVVPETTATPAATITPTATTAPAATTTPVATTTPTAIPTTTSTESVKEPAKYVYSSKPEFMSDSMAVSIVVEAEDGVCTGDNKSATSRKGYSGKGYITGFTQKTANSWKLKIEIPASQFYSITVRAASDSHKENFLEINGNTVGTIVTDSKNFADTVIDGVYIEKGTAELTVKESWGWFDLDKITITASEPISDDFYNGVSSELANKNSNEKTVKIMEYLVETYGNKIISGQYCEHNKATEINAIYRETGKYPALRGFDMIFMSPNSGWQNADELMQAKRWSEKGGLVTFSWHWHVPIGPNSFYAEDTTFRIKDARTDIDLSLVTEKELEDMFKNGTISENTYRLVADIDVISSKLKILERSNVTVLWRPLHEAAGGWFWWGASGSDDYLWLWKLMFNRMTNYHELNNLIWVWNGQSAQWYPGDEYVDIIGTDIYPDKLDNSSQASKLKELIQWPSTKKLAALTENGAIPDPDMLERDNARWLFFNTWYGDYIIDSSNKLNGEHTPVELVKKIYNSEYVITLDELPSFE